MLDVFYQSLENFNIAIIYARNKYRCDIKDISCLTSKAYEYIYCQIHDKTSFLKTKYANQYINENYVKKICYCK